MSDDLTEAFNKLAPPSQPAPDADKCQYCGEKAPEGLEWVEGECGCEGSQKARQADTTKKRR